ncbi:hypothetical protein EK21DRAFT_63224 [Setomelanomma holmii]|uniref:Uncharacterized protein n=1 Tax=Setomelanomma holmii TaxID=210430 RepID=A0A9P4HAI7_9PLEO|nr:hypothetical protein EK21DRAFT_63224 [Setomelanomma holmii]
MPPRKAPTVTAPLPTGSRPYNGLLLSIFLVLSLIGAWFMRIYVVITDAPVGFNNALAAGVHPNGVVIKRNYTGIGPLDEVLAMLTTAFLPGAAGWSEPAYWQQFHFLLQIAPFLAILNIEACRERNKGSWIKYTALFAFLYQNIGGAVVIPIWMLLFHRLSGQNTYFHTGRTVPLPYARLILPSTILLYLLPSLAIFYPGNSIDTLQTILAWWQVTPIFVNVPLWFASPFISSAPATGKAKEADTGYLKAIYYTIFLISTASHWVTIFFVTSSENPDMSLLRVFVPSPARWLISYDNGLLWIFQWDWIICALMYLVPAFVAICDLQRLLPDLDTDSLSDRMQMAVYIVLALTVLGGPGAAISGVWGWREEQMVLVEERAEAEAKKKGR